MHKIHTQKNHLCIHPRIWAYPTLVSANDSRPSHTSEPRAGPALETAARPSRACTACGGGSNPRSYIRVYNTHTDVSCAARYFKSI